MTTTPNAEVSQGPSLLLPNLKARSEVTPGAPGTWDKQNSKAFEDVALSLDYQAPGATRSISAVPTLWARPLLAEMALHDTEHPLHQEMLEEWEGMLAALALAYIRNFPIKAVLFELGKLRGQQEFADALLKLLPTATEHNLYNLREERNPWQEIYLWFWDGKPVGMTSPSTLVVPSEEADWGNLPWWQNQEEKSRLISPVPYLNQEEKQLLYLWLENVKQKLPGNGSEGKAASRLRKLLSNFQDKLVTNGDRNGGGPNIADSLVSRADYFGTTFNRGCLGGLGQPLKRPDSPSNISLKLQPKDIQPQRSGAQLPVLLIFDPDIAEQWNIPPQEITVHQGETLASLDGLSPAEWGKRQQNWEKGVRCVTKADLLLPKLTFITQGPPEQVLPGAVIPKIDDRLFFNDIEITPLLPLTPLLLDYFTPEALAAATELEPISMAQGPGIRVTVRLPLAGINGEGREFRLSQNYPLEEENAIEELPLLEIWPNFRTYAIKGEQEQTESNGKSGGTQAEPAVPENAWKVYYSFYCDNLQKTFRVHLPTVAGEPNAHYDYRDGKQGFQMDRLTDFPSYVQCQDAERRALGLILLKTPPLIGIEADSTWRVGVDLGTSSTNAFVNKRNTFEKVEFKDFSYRVTQMLESDRAMILPEFFIFTDKLTGGLPMSTVLTTRKCRTFLKRDQQAVIFDGRYYMPNLERFDVKLDYVKTGLKLDSRTEEYDRQLFLTHFLLQIMALAAQSGVAAIDWYVSFPSAFSKREQRFYKNLWDSLLKEMPMMTGIRRIGLELETESLASGRYFAGVEQLNLLETTCIDIGGGTSDISIWNNRDLIHQCSVQLAGRDLFTGILHCKPEFVINHLVKAINPGERNKLLELKSWNNLRPTAFDAKLDLFLRQFTNVLLQKRQQPEFEESEEFLALTTLISIGFGGLYYYLGLILLALHQERQYPSQEITPVYLAGNGSRFLHWIDPTGAFDEHSDINQFLSRMLSRGSGFKDTEVKTKLSCDPKSEAACGLVQTQTNLTGLEKPEQFLVAGEIYCFGGEPRSATARVQFDPDEDDIKAFDIPELEQLPKFLDDFHLALRDYPICPRVPNYKVNSGENGPSQANNEKLWQEVKRKLKDSLLDLKQDQQKHTKRSGEEVRIEPPFILALKALLDVLADQWSKRKFNS